MIYILLHLFYFIGMGSYFSTLSPVIIHRFGEDAWIVFTAGQLSFPAGFFLIGYLSDRFHALRRFLLLALLLQAPVQFFLFYIQGSLLTATLLNGLFRFLLSVIFQLSAIASMESRGTSNFGRIRAWGTIGFFIAQFSFFLLDSGLLVPGKTLDAARAGVAGEMGALFYWIALLPAVRVQRARKSHEEYHFRHALTIALRPGILFFLILSFLFFFSYQLVDYYLGRFLYKSGGMGIVYAGWSLAVLLEVPFMPLTARIYKRDGSIPLFRISTLAGVVRFLWISASIPGIAPLPVLYSQILHGIHFTGYYMGAIYWLRSKFPEHLFGTAYGIYNIFSVSLGGVVGNVLYGQLLYSKMVRSWSMIWIGHILSVEGMDPEKSGFFFLFSTAMALQFLLFFAFLVLGKLPEGRHSPEEDH